MSDDPIDPDQPKGPPTTDYEVGYGRPPTNTRWVSGQSGNPGGSSKRRRVKLSSNSSSANMVLAESNRRVKVREGDRPLELTMYQAMLRSLGVQGLKGSRIAAWNFIDLTHRAQKETDQQRQDLYLACIEYVDCVRPEFERSAKLGEPPPDFVPHPDDIEFDHRTGDVRILGPLTRDQQRKVEQCKDLRDQIIDDLRGWKEQSRQVSLTATEAAIVERFKALLDEINAVLPPRLRKTIDD